MNFLNLGALWGLLFLAVPILLLFLLSRKTLVLPWAAYEWMRDSIVNHRREFEITDLLKLISKLLLLLALTLFCARPFLNTRGQGGNLILALDVSPSMNSRLESGTRLERAKSIAAEVIDRHEGAVSLFTYGSKLDPIIGSFTTDKGLLKAELSRIRGAAGYNGAAQLIEQVRALPLFAEASRVMLLGDFQTCWYGESGGIARALDTLGSRFPMVWVQVDPRAAPDNVAITDLVMTPEGAFGGRPAFFECLLRNGLSVATGDRILTVSVDRHIQQRQIIRLKGGENRRLAFSTTFTAPGWHTLKLELDNDALLEDNVHYAAVNVPPPLNVVAVVPATHGGAYPADLYVKAALGSVLPDASLNYRSVSPLEFETLQLNSAHLVILFGLALMPGSPLAAQVETFTKRGGGVLAFLPAIQADEALAAGVRSTLVPESTLDPQHLAGGWGEFFLAPELKAESVRFKNFATLSGISPGEVRLVSTAGAVAAVRTNGLGRIAVVGFVPAPAQSSLPFNPNFVQLLLRMVWETRNWPALYHDRGIPSGRTDERAGDSLLPDIKPDRAYSLLDEKGVSRALTVEGVGGEKRLAMPLDLPAGLYSIREDGVERLQFGHNLDTGDSLLEPVTARALEQARDKGLTYTDAGSLGRLVSRRDFGWLTIGLLLAALLFEAYAHFLRKHR